jgi:OOP family OmpA-OmpF porin
MPKKMSRLARLIGTFCLSGIVAFVEAQTLTEEIQDQYPKTEISSINSGFPEVRPLISDDGNTLYFCRRYHTENYKGERDVQDVWVSYRDTISDNWSEPSNLGGLLNNKKSNAIASISPDGQEGIFFNTYKKTKKMPLVRSRKNNNGWTKPKAFEINDYVNISKYADFYLDFKNNVLLLAIEGDFTQGDQDLYISFPDEKGGWKNPVNMGPVLNTDKADFAPFMGAGGRSLFFCSYGHKGLGNSDIYMSVRLDNTWLNWSEPVNLGPSVNSAHEETYFSITSDFKYLYYTSYHAREKNRNITRVELPENFAAINGPLLVQLDSAALSKIMLSGHYQISPSGSSRNFEGVHFAEWPEEEEVIAATRIAATETETGAGQVQGIAESDAESVIVASLMQSDSLSQIVAAIGLADIHTGYGEEIREGSAPTSLSEAATELKAYLEKALPGIELNLRLEKDELEIKIGHNLMYEFNSLYVTTDYVPHLSRVARVMRERPRLKMKLVGYTDNIGSEEVNRRVASARAQNLLYFFRERGVEAERIEIVGAGEENPLTGNETEEGRAQNRRVETFIKYKE